MNLIKYTNSKGLSIIGLLYAVQYMYSYILDIREQKGSKRLHNLQLTPAALMGVAVPRGETLLAGSVKVNETDPVGLYPPDRINV